MSMGYGGIYGTVNPPMPLGMFANGGRKRAAFGFGDSAPVGGIAFPEFGSSGINPGDFAGPTAPTKPKFFGRGGGGWDILGGLADGILVASGQQATFGPEMAARRRDHAQAAREEARYQRERSDRLADWQMQQRWKLDHPDDQFTQYLQAAGIDPASTEGQALYRKRAENMAAPPLMAIDGFDPAGNQVKTFIPRTGIGMGGQPSPAGPPVGTVKNGYRFQGGNPNDRNSWVPAGGAPSTGGATFR